MADGDGSEIQDRTANNSKVPGIPFKRGDERINRRGRPKTAHGLRALARAIACEEVESKDKSVRMSRLELIFRDWSSSRDYRKQQALVESGYGKVANAVEISGPGGGPIATVELSTLPAEKLNAMLRAAGLEPLPEGVDDADKA